MNTVVGDPLYRPGLIWKNLASDLGDSPASAGEPSIDTEGRAYWRGAQVWQARGPAAGTAVLEKSAARLHSGLIYEGLALLLARAGDKARALGEFERAVRTYREPADAVRALLGEARMLSATDRKAEALNLLKAGKEKYAGVPAAAALDELMGEVTQPF